MDQTAALAMIRFGLGRRGQETLPADPHAWLTAQTQGPDPARFDAGFSTADGLTAWREDREDRPPPGTPGRVETLFRADAAMQLDHALKTDQGFRERLVWFWANHFTVSLRRGECKAVAGAFVREAIRPHVTGRFVDMLFAVMRHPAMLVYLDNQGSIGPDSPAGLKRHAGLNENLARECLELHTVSPAARYTQADVTAFANILTGWSIELKPPTPGFIFRPQTHQPGEKTVLGQRFPDGEAGGEAALTFLADHPATHRFLATKLATHFVADTPPLEAVRAVEAALRDTHGNLGAAAAVLVAQPAAWQGLTKVRSAADYTLAVLRAVDLPPDKRPDPLGVMRALGQPLWTAPLPNGWPDRAADWAGPEELLRRIDWAYGLAARAGDLDPDAVAQASLGPLLHPATQDAMRHAGSRRDALTLLLASPEFVRR